MNSTSEQLRFASIPGCTIRADFAGGGLSSDLGPLLLKGVDRQIGLTERVCAAIDDTRHSGYITHTLHGILKQRIYQIASGYEDGNDCNSLRHDPVFRLGVGCKPFDTEVMGLGENPRFVVTSLEAPEPVRVYEELYCGRGQAENWIKHLKADLASDRTSCTTFLANFMRLLEHAAAYVLHQQLRIQALQHTELVPQGLDAGALYA